jgi:C_GCAxxG_C_C family probable redox protein
MSKPSAKNHADLAKAHFLQGYNCARSTVAAFAEDFGLDPALLAKMTAGLGAGVGGLRQTCGPVSAMAILAGLSVGGYPPEDLAPKAALYVLVKRMRAEFVDRHGSDCCRELLERASIVPGFAPARMHHIHVWELGPHQRLLTAHLLLGVDLGGSEIEALLAKLKVFLREQWAIDHATIEPEITCCKESGLLGQWTEAGETEHR